ncbi:hypothetical protein GCM10023113_06950 [Cellulomonas oligotrophica]|uniref:Uncharacterized protein n=1 Tax=Cellulomonas oligotrophica TaxID=931536 RepID=A0ABQ4D9E0_9CELL|nr:hypothetical protein Col01nite_15110 [Cellulomonas oligotrophica]
MVAGLGLVLLVVGVLLLVRTGAWSGYGPADEVAARAALTRGWAAALVGVGALLVAVTVVTAVVVGVRRRG